LDTDSSRADDPEDGIEWQRAFYVPLTILAWLAVIVIVVWLLGHVAKTLLTLVLSAVVAFALTPLVDLLDRWIPRTVAIALAYLFGFGLLGGMIALLVVTAAAQVTDLAHNLPSYVDELHHIEPNVVRFLGPLGVTPDKFQRAQQQVIGSLQTVGTHMAAQSLAIVTGVLTTIIDVVLVLILSVYLTANGPRISTLLRRGTPRSQRWHATLVIGVVNRVIGGYIRGTLLMAALIGALVGVGMFVLGVPYPILLGLLAFFMEFIPLVGVFISGAVCVLVALVHSWVLALVVLAYFVGVHVVEGDVVGPRIMGRAVGIHPATALVALVAGTELFGVWGALFGAPIAGLIQAIGTAVYLEARGKEPAVVVETVVEEATVSGRTTSSGSADRRR